MLIEYTKSVSTQILKNFDDFPEAKKVYDEVSKYFNLRNVQLCVGERGSFSMEFTFEFNTVQVLSGIRVEYLEGFTVATGRKIVPSWTMCVLLSDTYERLFGGLYDSESYGHDLHTVFLSLLNGHREWVKAFSKFLIQDAEKFTKKVSKKELSVKKCFGAREYI